MTRALLSLVVALGLLTSGDPCLWLCQQASAGDSARAEMPSHCGGAPQSAPDAPAPDAPSHEDCPGCGLDTAASSAGSVGSDVPTGAGAPALGVLAAWYGVAHVPASTRAPGGGSRSPTRDVLEITSSLRL